MQHIRYTLCMEIETNTKGTTKMTTKMTTTLGRWMHPATGEKRVYINGAVTADGKVWLTKNDDCKNPKSVSSFNVHHSGHFARSFSQDLQMWERILDSAMEELGFSSWDEIVALSA